MMWIGWTNIHPRACRVIPILPHAQKQNTPAAETEAQKVARLKAQLIKKKQEEEKHRRENEPAHRIAAALEEAKDPGEHMTKRLTPRRQNHK